MTVVTRHAISIADVDDPRGAPIRVETRTDSEEAVVHWEGEDIYMYRDELLAFAGALIEAAKRLSPQNTEGAQS